MIKTGLIALIGTGVLGTGAVQADMTPETMELTAGFFTVELGGEDGFNARLANEVGFNMILKTEDGKSLTIHL